MLRKGCNDEVCVVYCKVFNDDIQLCCVKDFFDPPPLHTTVEQFLVVVCQVSLVLKNSPRSIKKKLKRLPKPFKMVQSIAIRNISLQVKKLLSMLDSP